MTSVKGYYLYVLLSILVCSLDNNVYWSFTKRSTKRKMKFEANFFSNKIIVTLVTQVLPSSSLSRSVV